MSKTISCCAPGSGPVPLPQIRGDAVWMEMWRIDGLSVSDGYDKFFRQYLSNRESIGYLNGMTAVEAVFVLTHVLDTMPAVRPLRDVLAPALGNARAALFRIKLMCEIANEYACGTKLVLKVE